MRIAAFLLLSLLPQIAFGGSLPKPLRNPYDNKPYPPACSEKELKKLRQEIFKLKASLKPQDAFDLASAMLCGGASKDEDFVLKRMINPLPRKSESTGETRPLLESLPPSASLLIRKQAWVSGPMAQIESDDKEEISVSYVPNEACASGFVLKFDGAQWKIVSLGEACD